MPDYGATDRVRRSARETYFQPARRRGESLVRIHTGSFGKDLVEHRVLQPNRFPLIYNALRSKKLLTENHATLIDVQSTATAKGPSSTVTFTYRLDPSGDDDRTPKAQAEASSFAALRGVLQKTYKQLGGAKAFHESERRDWER